MTSARTGMSAPCMRSVRAPSTSARPRVPAAWKPASTMRFFSSGREALQVMEHAAAGEHAAGGDDHARPGEAVELLRLLDVL